MVVYEVTISIDKNLYDQYLAWLRPHVHEMLRFAGFIHANVGTVKQEREESRAVLCVSYLVESEQHLNNYLQEHASRMRAEASRMFGTAFLAERRVIVNVESFNRLS